MIPFDPYELLKAMIEPLVLIVIAPFIISRLRKPNDVQRAEVIERIANDVANQLVAENPNARPLLLLQQFVQRLSAAVPASVATRKEGVYERVGVSALQRAGDR